MGNLSDDLAKTFTAHGVNLQRFNAGERKRIMAVLKRLEKELVEKLKLIDPTAPLQLSYRQKRQIRLLKETRETIATAYRDMSKVSGKGLRGLAEIESDWAKHAVNGSVGFEMLTTSLTKEQLRAIASDTLIRGARSSEWWSRQSKTLQNAFADEVRTGMAAGESIQDMVRRIRGRATGRRHKYWDPITGKSHWYVEFKDGIMDTSTRNASALVRTSVQQVAAQARNEMYNANADIIKGIQQLSTLDSDTTVICVAYAGASWDLEHKPINGTTLEYGTGVPRHWNCLPGDTLVLARNAIASASKRWFDGDMVIIQTAGGRKLTATPNHPILTDCGWMPAASLNIGSNVICDIGSEWRPDGDRNSENIPSSIHNVTEAFFNSRKVVTVPMPVASKDFHGDGVGSEIAVVGADRKLSDGSNSTVFQHQAKQQFGFGCSSRAIRENSLRRLAFLLKGSYATARGLICRLGKAFSLFGRSACHSGELLFATTPGSDTVFGENSDDGSRCAVNNFCNASNANAITEQSKDGFSRNVISPMDSSRPSIDASFHESSMDTTTTDVKLAADIADGKAGLVELDEVVKIDVEFFHGYVYNLETKSHYYSANSIITHNCRSIEIPIMKTWRELGIDIDEMPIGTRASMDGQVAGNLTMKGFLEDKSKAFQDNLLGKGKAELWRKGKITLTQLVDQTGRPMSLKDLAAGVRPLAVKAVAVKPFKKVTALKPPLKPHPTDLEDWTGPDGNHARDVRDHDIMPGKPFSKDQLSLKEFEELYKSWGEELSDVQKKAFHRYSTEDYDLVNILLRKGERGVRSQLRGWDSALIDKEIARLKRVAKRITAALDSTASIPRGNLVVYRGARFESIFRQDPSEDFMKALVGSSFKDKGFSSASLFSRVTNGFSMHAVNNAGGTGTKVLFRIVVPKSVNGGLMGYRLSANSSEYEFLLPAGQKYEIVNVSWLGKDTSDGMLGGTVVIDVVIK